MKIVYIINQLRRSGPVNVLYNIILNLDREKFTPIVIKLMHDDVNRSYTYKFKELGIEIIELDLSFWTLELRTRFVAKKIDKLLSQHDIKIINTHGYHPLLISSYMRTKSIKIDTMHCISIDSFRSSRGEIIGRYMHLRYIHRLKKIDCRVGISNTVTNYYDNIITCSKGVTIYNGVDTNIYNCEPVLKERLKVKLGLNEYKTIFVVVGHLNELKDPCTIIRAFRRLIDSRQLDDSCLIFCGNGPLYEKCIQLSHDYPMIKLVGFVNNVDEYLKVADFSICASHSEGFGLNYIEAVMCGCVVISSEIAAFSEFSSFYPKLGALQFAVSDYIKLADTINELMLNPIDINEIMQDACCRFSARGMSANYMSLYKQLSKEIDS